MLDKKLFNLLVVYFLMTFGACILIICNKHVELSSKICHNFTYWNLSHLITRIIIMVFFKEYLKLILFLDIFWEVCEYIYEEYIIKIICNYINLSDEYTKNIYDWNDIFWNIFGMILGLIISLLHNILINPY